MQVIITPWKIIEYKVVNSHAIKPRLLANVLVILVKILVNYHNAIPTMMRYRPQRGVLGAPKARLKIERTGEGSGKDDNRLLAS